MVNPQKLVRSRQVIIVIHIIVTLGFFTLSFLRDSILWLFAIVSFGLILLYIPWALWTGRRSATESAVAAGAAAGGKESRSGGLGGRVGGGRDWAGVEIGYLIVQMGLWMGVIVLGLMYAGPNECARWSFELGRAQASNPELTNGPGLPSAVISSCDLDTVLNVFSCLHFVLLAAWSGYIIYRVRRLPMGLRQGLKCGVTRILRGQYGDVNGEKIDPESGTGTNSTQRTGISDSSTNGITEANTIPPPLPPRPETGSPEPMVVTKLEPPPPAYDSTIPQSCIPSSQQPALQRQTTLTVRGEPIDFDAFMRIQQQRMEEKLALGRDQQTGASDNEQPLDGLESQGGRTWVAGESTRPGPSTTRRRRSA